MTDRSVATILTATEVTPIPVRTRDLDETLSTRETGTFAVQRRDSGMSKTLLRE